MRAVDTNVLIRVIIRDDTDQVLSAETFVEKGAWVSLIVLAETAWVLTSVYGLTKSELIAALQMLLEHRDFILQDADTVVAALKLFRHKPALGFADCLILECARKAGNLPLGTFDRNLSKIEGAQRL